MIGRRALQAALVFAATIVPVTSAQAGLVLSQLVVDITPANNARSDIEIWNNAPERTYVEAAPREIVNPGTPSQAGRTDPDPEKLGLLVSPSQMILEPGQRRLLRIAAISHDPKREHVYRVTVKPVVAELSAEGSALKVLIGYDILVIVRPAEMSPHVSGTRLGNSLILHNDGNVSVELVNGNQCAQSKTACTDLPDTRLYSGATATINIAPSQPVYYKLRVAGKLTSAEF